MQMERKIRRQSGQEVVTSVQDSAPGELLLLLICLIKITFRLKVRF